MGYDAEDSNLYGYVRDAPTVNADPTGLQNPGQGAYPPGISPPLADRLCKSMKADPNCAECNKSSKETMDELFKTARTTYVRFGPNHCFRWSDKFYGIQSKKDNKGCYTLKQVEWTYSLYKPFPETWRLGHGAVEITLCDGTVLYADDGWWGYFDSIFFIVPPYVYQTL